MQEQQPGTELGVAAAAELDKTRLEKVPIPAEDAKLRQVFYDGFKKQMHGLVTKAYHTGSQEVIDRLKAMDSRLSRHLGASTVNDHASLADVLVRLEVSINNITMQAKDQHTVLVLQESLRGDSDDSDAINIDQLRIRQMEEISETRDMAYQRLHREHRDMTEVLETLMTTAPSLLAKAKTATTLAKAAVGGEDRCELHVLCDELAEDERIVQRMVPDSIW